MKKRNNFRNVALATTLFTSASSIVCAGDLASSTQSIPSLVESKLTLSGDFLLWKAHVESAPYAYSIDADQRDVEISTKPRFSPGFRIGAAYLLGDQDQWEVKANWTHLHAKSKKHGLTDVKDGVFYMYNDPQTPATALSSANSQSKVKLNLVDLTLQKDHKLSSNCVVTPHMGFRATVIKNTTNSDWTKQAITTQESSESHYRGLGIRTGIGSLYAINSEFSLIGRVSTSILCGTAKETDLDTFSKNHRIRFNVESFLGVQWSKELCGEKTKLSLSAGYELSQWFHMANKEQSNIGFHGLTAKASYSF